MFYFWRSSMKKMKKVFIYFNFIDLDDEKLRYYDEYLKKMSAMAEETKLMENNMKQFADNIQNLVNSSHSSNITS